MCKFRPSAVPLITVDPFFSIWSMSDHLYDDVTHHWTGRRHPMSAGVFIDGTYYKIMGDISPASDRRTKNFEPFIPQTDLEVTPTQTKYTFANGMIQIELLFITPLLPDRPDILSRPVSYIEYDMKIIDDNTHDLLFHFDISAECCIDSYSSVISFGKTAQSAYCGNVDQNVLAKSGDSVCINWGYLHIACPDAQFMGGFRRFKNNYEALECDTPYDVFKKYPYMVVRRKKLHDVIAVAYDDIHPIMYNNQLLEDYYKKFYKSFDEMLEAAVQEYTSIKTMCNQFDHTLITEAAKYGKKYEQILSLAYRQAIAAHKLVEDKDGNLLFLSKECHSNGCIGTLDVTYPSVPLFLKYNPEFVKGMLRPIIHYAHSEHWTYEFAPHDVGQYPLANGQVYGMGDDKTEEQKLAAQMPVEECGNMLLCVAAIAKAEGSLQFALENRQILKQWADYLVKYGYNPGNQLCTDDFAGHLAHNCNLSLKAILGIAAYGQLFNDAEYLEIARKYAAKWQCDAANEEGTRLAFDKEDSWSMKYNIVWDKLLDLHIFDEEIFKKEIALYHRKMNRYGIPLDSREDYTKLDWLMWTSVMTDNKQYIADVIECIYNFINETPDRAPLSDWYYTSTGRMVAFQNRSVVGGLFILLL